jgi:hypothetical protein
MTNYDDVWGDLQKKWRIIQIPDKSDTWNTVAWFGMICFFVFGAASLLLPRSDTAFLLMGAALAVWITAGIVVIRHRRRESRILTSENVHD